MAEGYENQTWNNSENSYIKTPDGTLIQWGSVNITPTNPGNPFPYSGGKNVTFGIPFLQGTTPIVVTSPVENGGYWNSGAINISSTLCHIIIAGNTQAEKTANWIAIGRWK